MQLEVVALAEGSEREMRKALGLDALEGKIMAMFPNQSLVFKWMLRGNGDFSAEIKGVGLKDAGVFASVLWECKLEARDGVVAWHSEEGWRGWLVLRLKYRHFECGVRYMHAATFFYSNGEWTIERCKPVEGGHGSKPMGGGK